MAESLNGTEAETKNSVLIETTSTDNGNKNTITVLKANESIGVKVEVNGDTREGESSLVNNGEKDDNNRKETGENKTDDDSVSEDFVESTEDKLSHDFQSKTQIYDTNDNAAKSAENYVLEKETLSHKDDKNVDSFSGKGLEESEQVLGTSASNETNLNSEVKGAEAIPEVSESKSDKDKQDDEEEEEFRAMTEEEIQAIIDKYSFMNRRVRTKCLQFFWSLDVDRWGYFNYPQLRYWYRAQGTTLTDWEICRIFCDLDKDMDRLVSLDEFLLEMSKKTPRYLSPNELKDMFKMTDKNQDGFVCADDLRASMESEGLVCTPLAIHRLLCYDSTGKYQRLTFEDYSRYIQDNMKERMPPYQQFR